MKIKVTTPMGVYLSSEMDYVLGGKQHLGLKDLFESICENGAYFAMDTDSGKLFLPKTMIQQSVFELIY